jgi:nucleotide-binding universal stress UspA family protein
MSVALPVCWYGNLQQGEEIMPIRVKRILTAVDFSDTSDKAFDYALSFARVFGAEVIALHVLEDPIVYAPTTGQAWRDEFERTAQERLDAVLNKHTCEGVDVRGVLAQGTPFFEIINAANSENCDLIILGSHGHGAIEHLLLGSVAEKVVRKAKRPVLVVRPDQHQFVMP